MIVIFIFVERGKTETHMQNFTFQCLLFISFFKQIGTFFLCWRENKKLKISYFNLKQVEIEFIDFVLLRETEKKLKKSIV